MIKQTITVLHSRFGTGFLLCEHGCAASYALNEFVEAHIILSMLSVGLLVGGMCFLFVHIAACCMEGDPLDAKPGPVEFEGGI